MPSISFSFPTRQNLSNFMALVNRFTSWSLEGYYPDLQKPQTGRIIVTQSLPHLRVMIDWRTEGTSITLDTTHLELHFDPWNRDQALAHLRQLAKWQSGGR